MELVYVKRAAIFGFACNPTKLMTILEEFACSKESAAKVIWQPDEYASIASARTTLTSAIKRFRYSFAVLVKDNELYIYKR